MANPQQKITGYRDLNQDEINLINEIKEAGNGIGALIDGIEDHSRADPRWLAIAKTQLQQGFMALTRAVARPESF